MAGKTYSRNILAVKAKLFAAREQNKKLIVHFISGEMRASEWAKELNSCELLKEVEVTYMLDYVGYPNYEEIFWDAFAYGDIVICDSLPAIISHMKMSVPANKKAKPETQMIFDFIRRSLKSVEDNNNNVQLINQANKDGNYKGGTELPHMMSSMSFVKLDGTNRYMIFSKNRNNGKVKRKVFFGRKACGDIEFNVEAYEATYKKVNDKKETLDDFINNMDAATQRKLNGVTEGTETEMSADEMGTSGNTPEELAELEMNSIPAHLRDDDFDEEEEEDEAPKSMFGAQRNLEDEIAERMAEGQYTPKSDEEVATEIERLKSTGAKVPENPHFMSGGIADRPTPAPRRNPREEDRQMNQAIIDGEMEGDIEAARASLNK